MTFFSGLDSWRAFSNAALFVCLIAGSAHADTSGSAACVLKASARTFAVVPTVGMPSGASRTPQLIQNVYGDLKTTLVLFQCGPTELCYVTSSFGIYEKGLNTAVRGLVAKELGVKPEQVIGASSHNHTVPLIEIRNPEAWGKPGDYPPKSESNDLGREFMEKLSLAARSLRQELTPVSIEWGVAQESRVTYNRRGHRADGRAYFIREEDRVLLPPDYLGTIDPDAVVVVLRAENKKPVAALAFFTGHPVTGYNPEAMMAYGQWSQAACEKLSAHLGDVPVAFLQGCAGDINSKYLLTGTIEQAKQLGEYLGESFIAATKSLHRSKRTDLVWTRASVEIPQAPLPPLADLRKDLASIDDFIRRGRMGDENTMECVGMNFPKALTPPYRATLVDMVV